MFENAHRQKLKNVSYFYVLIGLIWYIVGYVYKAYQMRFAVKAVPWQSRLERQSRKREVVGSSTTVGKNFSFCIIFKLACITTWLIFSDSS